MRNVIWALLGALNGVRAVFFARRKVSELRLVNFTYGEGHITDSALIPYVGAALSASVYALLANTFTGNWSVFAFSVFVGACLRLTLIDIDTHVLPRGVVLRAVFLGLILLPLADQFNNEGNVGSMFAGAFAMWLILRLLELLSRGDMGGGDVFLGVMLGMYVGWTTFDDIFISLVLSFAIAGVFAIGLLAFGRGTRRTRFAFGPFLVLGAVLTVLR